MKIFMWVLIACLLLGGVCFYFYKVTSIGYEQSSIENIQQYKEAKELVGTLSCPQSGVSIEFTQLLQKKYPEKVIATKGNDLLIDGFQFRCVENESGEFFFKEVKD